MPEAEKHERAGALKSAESSSGKYPVSVEYPNQFCPVCSRRLESHRCKMVCRQCGYFMSCSEFE